MNVAENSDLKIRAKRFALRIIKLCEAVPKSQASKVIGRQLLRSGTSVAANYRAACRARSTAESTIVKMAIVEEEADESHLWMELVVEAEIVPEQRLADLM